MTVQQISKRFTLLERLIQVRHSPLYKPLDYSLLGPENAVQVDLPSSTHYINCYFRIIVAFRSKACKNVFETSDSKHYIGQQQSLWDECRRVSHCLISWWTFLPRCPKTKVDRSRMGVVNKLSPTSTMLRGCFA